MLCRSSQVGVFVQSLNEASVAQSGVLLIVTGNDLLCHTWHIHVPGLRIWKEPGGGAMVLICMWFGVVGLNLRALKA